MKKGAIYKRQVDKSTSQIYFRNVDRSLILRLDEHNRKHKRTRKDWFIMAVTNYLKKEDR